MTACIPYIGFMLLAIALIGTISSTIFLVLALLGAAKFHREARKQEEFAAKQAALPPVSLLKPVHGAEPRMRENLEGFFVQDYPSYEILFAADEENDAALDIIREVAARHPEIPCRILVYAHGRRCQLRHFGDQ